jgi:hypothetical protein
VDAEALLVADELVAEAAEATTVILGVVEADAMLPELEPFCNTALDCPGVRAPKLGLLDVHGRCDAATASPETLRADLALKVHLLCVLGCDMAGHEVERAPLLAEWALWP